VLWLDWPRSDFLPPLRRILWRHPIPLDARQALCKFHFADVYKDASRRGLADPKWIQRFRWFPRPHAPFRLPPERF
jgi:hypothetical protein